VTTGAGQHGAIFCKDRSRFVHTISLAGDRPRWVVRSREGKPLGELNSMAETPVIAQQAEFVTVGDSPEMHAVVIRPDNFDSRRRYPVIVSVYGGPRALTVTKSAQGYSVQQWMANQGFIVVSMDGRGTPNRGRAWERAIQGNLIDVPLNDQVNGLHALGNRFPEMDVSRVGITGWSFGGYFSALALERRPNVYQAAVAGAPVVDWRDYDTYYTERYMSTPEQNRTGYDASSGVTWAKDLVRPLLILHGTADDNVYFLHSLKLVDALFRAGKSFEFVPLPGYTHIVADSMGVTQVNQRTMDHFRRNLGLPQ
jgi:dipeptidyl-peptidase-4